VLSIVGNGAYAPLTYFFVALSIAAFGAEAWALVDAVIRPAPAFVAAGKQTKPIWLIILGVAFVLGLYTAAYGGVTSILAVVAFVAAAIYLVDVRPKVREFKRGRSTHQGPYGPW
jgi:Protein of unknown function (DUF2516)